MWSWTKRAPAPAPSQPEAPTRTDPDTDQAIETVAHALRTAARAPVDGGDDETAAACEAWAQHVLLGKPPPDRTRNGTQSHGGRREWGALRQYMTELRRREADRVGRSQSELRDFIWSFVHQLNRTVIEDEKSDIKTHVQLERLQRATELPLEAFKQEVLSTIHAVGQLLNERQERHAREAANLSAEMRALSAELVEARRQGAQDPLTQLDNRRALDAHLAQTSAIRNLFGEPATLIMLDVDHFKNLNDTYGHPAGDAVLKKLASCLAMNFPRRSDCVARFGGEEFAIVLRDANIKEATVLAERALNSIRNLRVEHETHVIQFTASFGITDIGKGESPEAAVSRADRALYAAKRAGRNRVAVELLPNNQ